MIRFVILCAALVALASPSADTAETGVYRQKVEQQFQQWLAGDLWPEALAAGVSRATFDAASRASALDWSIPELQPPGAPVVPPRVEWQAEFGSPGSYFNESRLSGLAKAGRTRAGDVAIDAFGAREALPRPGADPDRDLGPRIRLWFAACRSPRSACLPPRPSWACARRVFRKELIAALQIVERGDVRSRPDALWAGALGQPQFLPSLSSSTRSISTATAAATSGTRCRTASPRWRTT